MTICFTVTGSSEQIFLKADLVHLVSCRNSPFLIDSLHAVWFIRDGFIRDAFQRLLDLLEILRDEV